MLPNDAPSGLSAAEETALANYESAFSVRQVDAYLYPTGNVGMSPPVYGGSLDGSAATVTTAAKLQYRYLAHGIADWLTRGVHLGYWRNYLTVDSDDEFNADAEWSQSGKCTPNDTVCPAGTPVTTPSRMTPADASYAANWSKQYELTLELLYNGGASARFQVNGTDPLLTAFKSAASNFWWVNHTFTHQWLGCTQDFTVSPWQCVTDGSGATQWVDYATINGEVVNNIQWARQNGIPIEADELAPGEYSGLRILPQQPVDNPNLVSAINANGIKWVPLDASREPVMRQIGSALGVPRHPIDVFYNVDTKADETSEYNWIYDSTADGGSGLCQASGTTCLQPLSLQTGWTSFILPRQINTMLGAVVQNDPRPFMFHQSNLTGDRLLYPVVNGVLSDYNAVYAASAPIVNLRLSAAGAALHSQDAWAQTSAAGSVSGYVQGNTVTITGPAGTSVPVTVPNSTRVGTTKGAAFGSAYGGEMSAYTTLGSGPLTLVLKATPYQAGPATAPATATTSRATKSTPTINAAKNPAALPQGKLGSAIVNATNGAASRGGKSTTAKP